MEKTIFYSNNTNKEQPHTNWDCVKNCHHQHCVLLMHQINRLNQILGFSKQSKLLKHSIKLNAPYQKQNKQNQASQSSIYQQIQVLKQNYRKAMKLLQHFQRQNDQLFQQNQKTKSQMKDLRLKKTLGNRKNHLLEYSQTKQSQNVDIDCKNSFYTETTQRQNNQDISKQLCLQLNFALTPQEGSNFMLNQRQAKTRTHDEFYISNLTQQSLARFNQNQNAKSCQVRGINSKKINEDQSKIKELQKQMNILEGSNFNLSGQIRRLKKMIKNRNSIQKLRHQLIQQLQTALT